MSLVLPVMYHWSPTSARPSIKRYGLRPTCATIGRIEPPAPGGTVRIIDRDETFLGVCLGTSPSHAWSLSGMVFGDRADSWDLWQVSLDEHDEVHPLPFFGYRLDEVRVANRIPKRRVWYVATRTV